MSSEAWRRLALEAKSDDAAIGLVLTGGRGKGVWTERSDWDGVLLVSDSAVERWRGRDHGGLDLTVIGTTAFETYAEPFTPFAWRGYDFARLTAELDRGGFQESLDRKGRLGSEAAGRIAEEAVGGALNQLYRAAKNARDRATVATRLDLIEFVPYLLGALFALEHRHRPYNKLLAWDLEQQALDATETDRLLGDIDAVVMHADLAAAWRLETTLEGSCAAAGLTATLEDWADHLAMVRPG